MKFKSVIPSNDDNGYLALTEDGTLVGFCLDESYESGERTLTVNVCPVNVVVPPSEAPANMAPSPTTAPVPGQIYRSRTWPEIRWLVIGIDPLAMFPIRAQRCDGQDQSHVGGWRYDVFAENMVLVLGVG